MSIWSALFARGSQGADLKKVDFEIKFKTDRVCNEFEELQDKNYYLEDLINDVAQYCKKEFDKNITITMIYRTDEEQDNIYKDNERYQFKKFKSPHQFWQAVDLRSRDFTEEEITQLVDYINKKYNVQNYYKWTAKNHEVNGHGEHFHIQYLEIA